MRKKWLNIALWLAVITVAYNLVEGVISVWFGVQDSTIALLGFGVDSFVEVISGIGILHMMFRMYRKGDDVKQHDRFERDALRVTGTAFYLLAAGLIIGGILKIIQGYKPDTTVVGIIISTLSILTMYFLMRYKLKAGKILDSEAIIADANCTRSCFYLSFILLFSSGLYELLDFAWLDVAGSFGIAIFAFREGKESFEKASAKNLSCSCGSKC
ncbi:MAG: cation transporter [Bacteroidales bacterium]|nr:cation transporter [Bacteroidales bacterium]MCF8327465.1 cation transporter [Bacteroidales bacterium]